LQGKIAIFVEKSGYGVKPPWMERMAASDPPYPHPSAFKDTVFLDRLDHIFRAGRCKATVIPQMRRNDLLIEANEECKDVSQSGMKK
jgi:hypothetical protein